MNRTPSCLKSIFYLWAGLLWIESRLPVAAQVGPDIIWATNAHFAPMSSVSISADSTRLASGSLDRHGKVWSVSDGALIRDVFSANEWILSTALSSDGTLLATGGDEGKTRVWRVSDGVRLLFGGPDDEVVHSERFSPDNSFLAIGRSDGINVWSMQTGFGIPFGEPAGSEISDVRFSPDGTLLASANDNFNASLWTVPGGTFVRDFIGHSNGVSSVDFSPDGKLLATASADGTARIWNVTNGVCLLIIDGGGGTARFSADGRLLYTLANYAAKIWHVANGALAGAIVNTGGALTFDIAKNGKYFAYGTESGTVVLARMPLVIDEFSRTGNETVLHWQGGSGLYQLQSSTNLASGSWENIGSATTNQLATNLNSSTLFFRVQSLPNP